MGYSARRAVFGDESADAPGTSAVDTAPCRAEIVDIIPATGVRHGLPESVCASRLPEFCRRMRPITIVAVIDLK
jgi:hypothetical protein